MSRIIVRSETFQTTLVERSGIGCSTLQRSNFNLLSPDRGEEQHLHTVHVHNEQQEMQRNSIRNTTLQRIHNTNWNK